MTSRLPKRDGRQTYAATAKKSRELMWISNSGTQITWYNDVSDPLIWVADATRVPLASYAITGLRPTVYIRNPQLAGSIRYPSLCGISIQGLPPSVTIFKPVVEVGVGSIEVSGMAPNASQELLEPSPDVAHVELAGLAPSIGTSVETQVGSASIDGMSPTFTVTVAAPTSAGSMTAQGLAPTLLVGIGVPIGSISYQGLAPLVESEPPVPVPAGSLELQGLAPSAVTMKLIVYDIKFEIGVTESRPIAAGSVVIQGLSPTLLRTVHVPAGSVVVQGVAPEIASTPTMVPPDGECIIQGLAPTLVRTKLIVYKAEFRIPT